MEEGNFTGSNLQGGREVTVPLLNLPCGSVCTHHVPWYTITPQMLRRMSHRTWRHIRLCSEHDGAHTDPLDVQWLSPHGKLSQDTVTSQPLCISSHLCFCHGKVLVMFVLIRQLCGVRWWKPSTINLVGGHCTLYTVPFRLEYMYATYGRGFQR
jgi:hypothetical protein